MIYRAFFANLDKGAIMAIPQTITHKGVSYSAVAAVIVGTDLRIDLRYGYLSASIRCATKQGPLEFERILASADDEPMPFAQAHIQGILKAAGSGARWERLTGLAVLLLVDPTTAAQVDGICSVDGGSVYVPAEHLNLVQLP